MSDTDFNRKAAEKLAEKKDFKTEDMLFCSDCGRTVIRTQKIGNPGFKDGIFCTCTDVGLPMVPVEKEDND